MPNPVTAIADERPGMTSGLPVNRFCPWSGAPIDPQCRTTYRGHQVAFCNRACRDKFAAAIDCFEASLRAPATGLSYLGRLYRFAGVQRTSNATYKSYEIKISPSAKLPWEAACRWVDAVAPQRTSPPRVGFLILHQGEERVWLLVNWWAEGGILCGAVASAPHGGDAFASHFDPQVRHCVWEGLIFEHEREAWITARLGSDPTAYLADILAAWPASL